VRNGPKITGYKRDPKEPILDSFILYYKQKTVEREMWLTSEAKCYVGENWRDLLSQSILVIISETEQKQRALQFFVLQSSFSNHACISSLTERNANSLFGKIVWIGKQN